MTLKQLIRLISLVLVNQPIFKSAAMKNFPELYRAFLTVFFLLTNSFFGFSQETESKDRNWRVEVEPASFALRGAAGSVMYTITEDNRISVGLYGASVDVPVFTRANMFENVGGDTSSVRLGMQIAVMARYKIELFKQYESNPYIGFIGGWEYFDISQPTYPNSVRLSTFVITPYLGYEFYFFKKMLYINPQIRSVFYLGAKTNDSNRPERMGKMLFLPQVSVGIRF